MSDRLFSEVIMADLSKCYFSFISRGVGLIDHEDICDFGRVLPLVMCDSCTLPYLNAGVIEELHSSCYLPYDPTALILSLWLVDLSKKVE